MPENYSIYLDSLLCRFELSSNYLNIFIVFLTVWVRNLARYIIILLLTLFSACFTSGVELALYRVFSLYFYNAKFSTLLFVNRKIVIKSKCKIKFAGCLHRQYHIFFASGEISNFHWNSGTFLMKNSEISQRKCFRHSEMFQTLTF